MATRRHPTIVDADGRVGRLREVRVRSGGHAFAAVFFDDGGSAEVPFEALRHDDDGGYVLSGRWREFPCGNEHSLSLPVIEERVVTSVRAAPERRVRIKRRVVSEARIVETPIERERIEIEHIPVNAFVDRAPDVRQEGDTMIVPCIEEVVVVEKRLRVREELRIRRVRERQIDRQNVVVRRHEVSLDGDEPTISLPPKKQGEDR